MLNVRRIPLLVLFLILVVGLNAGVMLALASDRPSTPAAPLQPHSQRVLQAGQYALLGWNDLGMHCYNRDFSNLAVLPPFNTLWAQVILRGNPPQIVTAGITVEYSFPQNTYSTGKSNFWDTPSGQTKQIAQALFGLPAPLEANYGLPFQGHPSRTLFGTMELTGDHFEAVGIPLTEYNDNDWNNRYPYQLAHLVAKDAQGNVLATQDVVAPVSTEMRCDYCHSDGGVGGVATGKVETNILTYHDQEAGTSLMNSRPVLCAGCHSSNALGAPGQSGLKSLSNAMHEKHVEANIPATTAGCSYCHPGPQTQCLRDAMTLKHGFTCVSCHGDLNRVAGNTNPWFNEPRCDNGGCHDPGKYGIGGTQVGNQTIYLYRMTTGTTINGNFTGHGGIYCEGCHDSTHAIAQSREPNDAIKFINLQGHAGTLAVCSVCHTGPLLAGTIHPLNSIAVTDRLYVPLMWR